MNDQGITEGNLAVTWTYRNEADRIKKVRTYIVVCVCQNSKLMLAQVCVRCHNCGRGHSYEEFLKKKIQAEKMANLADAHKQKIKQWRPPRPKNPIRLNVKTAQLENISWDDYTRIKRPTIKYICPKCKREYLWGNAQYIAGVSPPLLVVDNELQCFTCLRVKFKSEK